MSAAAKAPRVAIAHDGGEIGSCPTCTAWPCSSKQYRTCATCQREACIRCLDIPSVTTPGPHKCWECAGRPNPRLASVAIGEGVSVGPDAGEDADPYPMPEPAAVAS